MTLTIKLDNSQRVRLNCLPYVLTDDKTVLLDVTSKYNLQNAVFVFHNGEVKATVKYQRPLRVPERVLFGGKISISVYLYVDGQIVKDWQIYPLIVKEVEDKTTLFDWCDQIEKKLAELDERTKIIL